MKNRTLFAALCTMGFALSAFAGVILTDDVEYTKATAPTSAKAMLPKNRTLEFSIQEDATTGFVWSATYDKKSCQVFLEHKAAKNKLGGKKEGKVKVKIVSLTDDPFTVELDSAKPWERETKKEKIVKCQFNLADSAEFKSLREEGGNTSIPDGASYSLQEVPVSGVVNIAARNDVKIKIEEDIAGGNIWSLTQCAPDKAKVEIEHNPGNLGMKDKAEIKIKGLSAGYTILKFAYGNPGAASFVPKRMITCFVIIR